MEPKEYWRSYVAVSDMMHSYGLTGTDTFISDCIERIKQDADDEWNEDDIRSAIRNKLNELLENL